MDRCQAAHGCGALGYPYREFQVAAGQVRSLPQAGQDKPEEEGQTVMQITFHAYESGGLAIKRGRKLLELYELKAALEFKDSDQIVSDLRSIANTYLPAKMTLTNDEIVDMLDFVLPGWMGEDVEKWNDVS